MTTVSATSSTSSAGMSTRCACSLTASMLGRLVDADGPEGAALLLDHVAADPADVVGEVVLGHLFGAAGGGLELLRARPCLFPTDHVGVHLGSPPLGDYRLTVGNLTGPRWRLQSRRDQARPSEGAREALVEAAHELFVERDYDLRLDRGDPRALRGQPRRALPPLPDQARPLPGRLSSERAAGASSESRPRCPPARARSKHRPSCARGYLRAAETDDELRRIGLGQSRAVLGWEGWREACDRARGRRRARRCHRCDRGGRTPAATILRPSRSSCSER